MTMPLKYLLVALFFVTGCATSDSFRDDTGRPAENVPSYFLVGSFDGPETTQPRPGQGCQNPMVDPRDGTQLRLARSAAERGDYAVPEGRYGVANDEYLRLDCGTGQVLGIVPR